MKDIEILKKSIDDSNFSNKEELINIIKNLEGNLKNKKYGLVWEEKTENIKEDLKNKFIYLEEDVDKRILKIDNGIENILIEGDNLESLMALQYTHKNLIDVIYIDPPYNTGNKDFTYNDKYIDKDNSWKHSCWLSFMSKRLKLAKELLTECGAMFISIDDNEFAQLKLLCDEIFGENNVEIMIWNKEAEGSSGTLKQIKRYRVVHEYIIVCYKNKLNTKFAKISEPLKNSKFQTANLAVNKSNEKEGHENWFEIISPTNKSWYKQWKFSKDKIDDLINENLIYWGKDGNNQPRLIIPSDERRKVYSTSIISKGSTTSGRKDLEKIIPSVNFSYPKPLDLIKHLISMIIKEDIVVLDFFAGSGTTGQAVLELNTQIDKNIKFILCTNNENNICEEITYERINKVINGYINQDGERTISIPSNLRYYKIKKIEKTNNNELDQFNLLNKTLELIEIKENAFNLTSFNKYYSLLENKNKVVGLYSFGFIDAIEVENMLDKLIEKNAEIKVAYMPVEDISEIYDYIDDKYIGLIRFEKMPKELIEIYNKLNRN